MKTSTSFWIIIILVVILGIIWITRSVNTPAPTVTQNTFTSNSESSTTNTNLPALGSTTISQNTPTTTIVIYGQNEFSPSTITIHKGDKVTFMNQSGGGMWVASDPHPTHEGYSGTTRDQHCPDTTGTAFDQCSAGASYSFVFQKIGNWGYHNHTNPISKGLIIVK